MIQDTYHEPNTSDRLPQAVADEVAFGRKRPATNTTTFHHKYAIGDIVEIGGGFVGKIDAIELHGGKLGHSYVIKGARYAEEGIVAVYSRSPV